MHQPALFVIKYLMSCACLANVFSLLQLHQLVQRCLARRCATTARKSVTAEEPLVFAWGYWYAWSCSMFLIAIGLSTAVPCTLPCAFLFFYVRHWVDRHNLRLGVYLHGERESENSYVIRAIHTMRSVVGAWWFLEVQRCWRWA